MCLSHPFGGRVKMVTWEYRLKLSIENVTCVYSPKSEREKHVRFRRPFIFWSDFDDHIPKKILEKKCIVNAFYSHNIFILFFI